MGRTSQELPLSLTFLFSHSTFYKTNDLISSVKVLKKHFSIFKMALGTETWLFLFYVGSLRKPKDQKNSLVFFIDFQTHFRNLLLTRFFEKILKR